MGEGLWMRRETPGGKETWYQLSFMNEIATTSSLLTWTPQGADRPNPSLPYTSITSQAHMVSVVENKSPAVGRPGAGLF